MYHLRQLATAAVLLANCCFATPAFAQDQPLSREQLLADFQKQRIVPEKGGFVFAKGRFPQLRWEQPLVVREVWGSVPPLNVRWFDATGNEVDKPVEAGRYAAYIESRVPDGPVIRRARTFYAFDPAAFTQMLQDAKDRTQPITEAAGILPDSRYDVLNDAYKELSSDAINKYLFSTERGAILFAAAGEFLEADKQMTQLDHPLTLHQAHHLKIRRTLMGVTEKYPALNRPTVRDQPAPELREGSAAEAGFDDELPGRLGELCEQWLEIGGEPFTLVVARSGVVVFHESFGQREGQDVTRDTAYPMFSITKSMTGLMAAQFFDQGLLQVDQPIGEVLADFPTKGVYVPTFRDCLMHTSGIEGQIAFDGLENPWMDNVIANGWDMHEQRYAYSGTAMDVVGFAMAVVSGKSVPRLFHENMFEPLGFENARVKGLGFGGELRAIDLAKLGQLLLNEGAYGSYTFFGPETYQKLLPQPYDELYPHLEIRDSSYGLAIRHAAERHPDAGTGNVTKDATIFSENTLGHGSFSGSIWRIDPENELVIAMGRFASGKDHARFSRELFTTVVDAIRPE